MKSKFFSLIFWTRETDFAEKEGLLVVDSILHYSGKIKRQGSVNSLKLYALHKAIMALVARNLVKFCQKLQTKAYEKIYGFHTKVF